jgi:hypothetical protein
MAREHEGWLLELFSGLDAATIRQLHSQLGRLRVQLVTRNAGEGSGHPGNESSAEDRKPS